MTPQIILEKKEYLVISKPSGLIVHGDGKTNELTLADWILENYPEIENVGEPFVIEKKGEEDVIIPRPGIVHRLDRETSGVMIIARTQEFFDHIKEKFQNREVEKTYHAFVYGHVKNGEGVIDASIGKSKKDFRLWSAQRGAGGKLRDALTEYKILKRFESDGEPISLVELSPKTGRTHQLRVHMKYLNHPILCDKLYAPKRPCLLDFNRVALHAHKIVFKDLEGEIVEVDAPYPEDFEKVIEKLEI